MKKQQLNQIRKQSRAELEKKLAGLRLEVLKNSVKLSVGEENNLKVVKNMKREIAQILTILKDMPKEKVKKETKK